MRVKLFHRLFEILRIISVVLVFNPGLGFIVMLITFGLIYEYGSFGTAFKVVVTVGSVMFVILVITDWMDYERSEDERQKNQSQKNKEDLL